jgi:hypothetical protein
MAKCKKNNWINGQRNSVLINLLNSFEKVLFVITDKKFFH